MQEKDIYKFFKKSDFIKVIPIQYETIRRNKLVTYMPSGYLDKLMFELSFAGAGNIGNYTHCSFRMEGIGTFLPQKKANPFSGKINKLSFEKEYRLEMEFDIKDTDSVIDTLIKYHPYEEPAYEIYDFKKRGTNPSAYLCSLRNKMSSDKMILKINKNLQERFTDFKKSIKSLIISDTEIDDSLLSIANKFKADCIISLQQKQTKIKIL